MASKVPRHLLPALIVVLCLPSTAMGVLGLVRQVADLVKPETHHLTLAILLYTCSLIIGFSRGHLLVGAALGLWVWLIVVGDRLSTKIWTAAILLAAIYGLHLFHSEFQMR